MLLINIVILCLITLAAIAVAAFFYLRMRRSDAELQTINDRLYGTETQEKDLYTKEEMESRREDARIAGETTGEESVRDEIRDALAEGTPTLQVLRDVYENDVVISSGGRYHFYPIDDSIGVNPYHADDFATDADGILTYQGTDPGVRIEQGIHVSAETGAIDWEAVAADHVDYVMVYIGGRDDDGDFAVDTRWESNVRGAYNAGLTVGIWYSLDVISNEEAQEDADLLIDLLEPYTEMIEGYAAVEVRTPESDERTAGVDSAARTAGLQTVCNTLLLAGYQPLIYETLNAMILLTEPAQLTEFGRWISTEGTTLYFPYSFTMWRYAANAEVDGIDAAVPRDALIITQ